MAQQTAVEWFFDKLKNHEIQAEHFALFEQAKAMEKEQIGQAYMAGLIDGMNSSPKEYYNETYGSQGSPDTSPNTQNK